MSDLEKLRQAVSDCEACPLHKTRTNVVFDRGPSTAPLMVIGEAPGEHEDAVGKAFVGPSGKYLNTLLAAGRVPIDGYYCANVLKCRPPKNRFPEDETSCAALCRGYLVRQIRLVKPIGVLLLGMQALRYVLLWNTSEEQRSLFPWINKQFRRKDLFGDVRFLVAYHPSYMMRSNIEEDEEAWIQAVSSLWTFIQCKLEKRPPAPMAFTDISSTSTMVRQGRNLFRNRGELQL